MAFAVDMEDHAKTFFRLPYKFLNRSTSQRIDRIDALRGFSLLTIAVVHFMEQYLGALPPPEHTPYARHNLFDTILEGVMFVLLRGEFRWANNLDNDHRLGAHDFSLPKIDCKHLRVSGDDSHLNEISV